MSKAKALFRACSSKGVSHHHLGFGRDSQTSRGMGKLYSGKSEGVSHALIGGCVHGEAGGGLTRNEVSHVIG